MLRTQSKIYNKIIAMILIAMLVGNVSFAASLTDVTSSHWANTVVQNMVDQNIMAAYDDGSFKPDTTATKAETLITIYRAAIAAGLLTEAEGATLATKYETQLSNLGIPKMLAPYAGDVYPAFGYALEHEIVVLDEVKYFVSSGTFTSVSKVEASVYYGKALNLYKNENLDKVFTLSYKDAFEISLSALKYVNLLIDYDIVSSKGDSSGNFNPKTILNRAVLAVFVNGYFNAITTGVSEAPTTDTTTTTTPTETTTTTETTVETTTGSSTVVGTVTDVFTDLNYLEVKSTSGKVATYDVKGSDIVANQVLINLSQIEDGDAVTLTIESSKVTRVEIDKDYDSLSGTFAAISDYVGTGTSFRSLRVLLESGGNEYKRVYDDTMVTIDGVSADIDDISANYYVTVYFDGYDAVSVVAYSGSYTFDAVMNLDFSITKLGKFSVTLADGTKFVTTVDKAISSAILTGSTYAAGDVVEINLSYGKVKSLKFLHKVRNISGTIKEIAIKAEPELTIDTGDDDETVEISSSADILSEDGTTLMDIYDLRLGQIITVHVGIEGVDSIRLGQVVDNAAFNATVSSVIQSSNILIVINSDNDSITVAFANDATVDASDFEAGDKVYISGKKITDTLFEAETITTVSQ